jgi:hypothetical protein
VVVSSPSSVLNVLLPLLGLILGALLTYWLSGATSKRLRRNEQRFVGYVAIQRFLASTFELAEFDASDFIMEPPRVRPGPDVIGPEAQAIANLVASHRVLEVLGGYTRTLGRFNAVLRDLNATVFDEASAAAIAERQRLGEARIALVGQRDALLEELETNLSEVNAAIRKDLNIEAIDWSAFENAGQ